MNVVDCGSYCIVNINNQLYRYDYTGGLNVNNVTEELVRSQGTAVKPGQILQMGMVDENQFAELGFDPDDDAYGETANTGTTSKDGLSEVDYNNWLVNNGLSGISKLSSESKLEDIQAYYEQIANKLSSIMSSIDTALASKDPDTIDAYMTELTYNMAALDGVSKQSGMGSLVSSDLAMAGMWGGAAVAGAATMIGATGTLFTVAGVSATIPGIGWAVAGVCAVAAIGIGIYNSYKQGQIDDLKEKMQQTMDDCTAKLEYAQKEIGETVDDVVSSVTESIEKLEQSDFSDINDMNDVFTNINGILVFQASIEKWADICEKYGVPFEGEEILEKLGDADNKNKYADEYIENFVEHTKNAIETSGNVVDDTGSYIASADEITALISMLFDSEMTRQVNTAPLTELIQFIQERNQDDVYNDAGTIGDGMYSGGGDYNFGGYSDAYTAAGENQTGVDGAAADGQYDVDTTKYEEVQKEAQEAAQKDIDEYLDGIEISGKSVEDLEELYETTKADLEDFSQYKENLDLDLNGFDTVFSNIRKEQQARVDEYISSVAYSGKSIGELEELHGEVSAQGEAFKKASSEVDTSAFDDVLSNIRSEQQSIVDKKADELSSKAQSGSSLSQLTSLSSEIEQYTDSVSGYSVNTGKLSAISDIIKGKIQTVADEKAANYEIKATSVKTSDDCIVLADVINIEISQFQGTGADTSGLQKIVADLISKANVLRIEEAKKKAEEDAANTSASTAGTADTTGNSGSTNTTDAAQIPMALPADDGEMPVPDDDTPVEDAETSTGEDNAAGNVATTPGTSDANNENAIPSTGEDETPTGEIQPPAGETEESGTEVDAPSEKEPVNTENTEGNTEEPPVASPEENANPPVSSNPEEDGKGDVDTTTEAGSSGSGGIISVGEADETTPPPASYTGEVENVLPEGEKENIPEGEIEQTVQEGIEEGKTPEEIADLIEIEVEE